MSSRYLSGFDESLTNGVGLSFSYRQESVRFQFPPVITADSRRVSWTTKKLPGRDPIATYENNSAREMTMKIEYIVEDANIEQDGGNWTIGEIKYNVNLIKGYFTGVNSKGQAFLGGGKMTVIFTHTNITGLVPWSMRIGNVNVAYEGPQIGQRLGGRALGRFSYPLKTIVTLDLATVTSGSKDSSQPEKYWSGLRPFPDFDDLWY